MFSWARNLRIKEGTEANNITTFKNLNVGLFVYVKKLKFNYFNSRLIIFAVYWT